jgi:hypothetical protein
MAELQKIKREKAAEEREKEDLKKQEEEKIRSVILLTEVHIIIKHHKIIM